MIKVHQTVVDPKRGNCHQAVIASLLELELEQVPHFRLYEPIEVCNEVEKWFLYAMGYQYEGYTADVECLKECFSIGGYFSACVKSKTFENCYHAVIIDCNGVVVHDPNPKELWLGVNVIKTGELEGFDVCTKRKECMVKKLNEDRYEQIAEDEND